MDLYAFNLYLLDQNILVDQVLLIIVYEMI